MFAALDSPVRQAEATFTLPISALESKNFFLRIGRPRRGVRHAHSPVIQEARRFGSELFDALLQSAAARSARFGARHSAHRHRPQSQTGFLAETRFVIAVY